MYICVYMYVLSNINILHTTVEYQLPSRYSYGPFILSKISTPQNSMDLAANGFNLLWRCDYLLLILVYICVYLIVDTKALWTLKKCCKLVANSTYTACGVCGTMHKESD